MPRLKLAVDAFNLGADQRGMGRFARTVLSGLAECADIDVTLVVRTRGDIAGAREESRGAVLALADARRQRFDAVWYPWNALRFELSGTKIVTIHDAFAFTQAHRNPLARWREQRPIRQAIRRADILTTVSHWSARQIARVFALAPSRFEIVSPVPSAFWHPSAPAASGPYILFVAGPDARKNARMLFAAFQRAFPAGEVTLVIAGTLAGVDAAALSRTTMAYRLERPDDAGLRALYSGALAVAIPSLSEGYGVMAVEAMACGAAVVASDTAALPEACDGAALLVAPTSVDEWAAALKRVAGLPSVRADLQRRSLERAARIDRQRPATAFAALVRRRVSGG